MRPYSAREKQIIESLVREDKVSYQLIDFIQPIWLADFGKFEISSFQQLVVVHAVGSLDHHMNQLLEIIDLIAYLEKRGYVTSWQSLPMVDNTVTCGVTSEGVIPQFLPDMSVSSKLLSLANHQFKINSSLKDLVDRDFASSRLLQVKSFKTLILACFSLLIVVNLLGIFFNYTVLDQRVAGQVDQLQQTNQELLKQQYESGLLLDSLNDRVMRLLVDNGQIDSNRIKLEEIRKLIQKEAIRTYQLKGEMTDFNERLVVNSQFIRRVDSLIDLKVRSQTSGL